MIEIKSINEERYQNNCDMKLSYDKEIQIEMKAGEEILALQLLLLIVLYKLIVAPVNY